MSLPVTDKFHERDGVWENNTPAGAVFSASKDLTNPGVGQRIVTQNVSFRIRSVAPSTVRISEFRIEAPIGTVIFRMGCVSPLAAGFRGGKFNFPGGCPSPQNTTTRYTAATLGETNNGVTTYNLQAKGVYQTFEA